MDQYFYSNFRLPVVKNIIPAVCNCKDRKELPMFRNRKHHFNRTYGNIWKGIAFLLLVGSSVSGETLYRQARETFTPIEMDRGDTLMFTLRNGEIRTLILLETSADIIITNLAKLKEDQPGGATLYHFTCQVLIDGHLMKMERYVGSQESFYEPYVINGMRIWFDGVDSIGSIIKDEHGGKSSESVPQKNARFAITDMTMRICPSVLFPMYPNPENYLRISDSYNGDDCWMGAYNGFELHGGLDVNFPPGTPNFTPFQIDDHYLFNSLEKGDNNNRWRGWHVWNNGDRWTIQNHHLLNLRIPEHTPIEPGTHYTDAAGVHLGSFAHSHYVFRIKTPLDDREILVDPWIIFWQTFEDNRERSGETKAIMAPLSPGKTGIPVQFDGSNSRLKNSSMRLSYYWTFGDGTTSIEKNPKHIFVKPGIYPVTLLVDDGIVKSSFTQHITIDGGAVNSPSLALACNQEPSFRLRPTHIMDVYGVNKTHIPNSLHFLAWESRPKPNLKTIELVNIGKGTLKKVVVADVHYFRGNGWLALHVEWEGNHQRINVSVDGNGLSAGIYSARVRVEAPGSVTETQYFQVNLTIPTYPPSHRETLNLKQEIVDNADIRENRFYCTPYFWVAPEFKRWQEKGYKDLYLTNGGRAIPGEFARFRPDLAQGTYELYFSEKTPYDPAIRAKYRDKEYPVDSLLNPIPRFQIKVYSRSGENELWVKPTESLYIGKFEFWEGMDGYVDILSEGSVGQVLVDALIFRKVEE